MELRWKSGFLGSNSSDTPSLPPLGLPGNGPALSSPRDASTPISFQWLPCRDALSCAKCMLGNLALGWGPPQKRPRRSPSPRRASPRHSPICQKVKSQQVLISTGRRLLTTVAGWRRKSEQQGKEALNLLSEGLSLHGHEKATERGRLSPSSQQHKWPKA